MAIFNIYTSPGNILAIFNQLFEPGSNLKSDRRTLADYSYQDLFTIYVPFMVCVFEFFVILLYIFDSSRIQLLHFRFLPEFNKNPVVLVVLLIPDIFYANFLFGSGSFLLTHQVLFLEKCHVIIQNVQEEIRYFKPFSNFCSNSLNLKLR